MTYGEALGAEGRGLFKMAALTFFVELQKEGAFSESRMNADIWQAMARARVFVSAIAETFAFDMSEDETQEEGDSNE